MADSAEPQKKEMTVGLTVTVPLSVAQFVQEYMDEKSVGRSEVVTIALDLLRKGDEQREQAA